MGIVSKIKSNPRLKKWVLFAISPSRNPRPRFWVRWFLNPYVHKKGKRASVRRNCRMDVFPWNQFHLGELSTIESYCVINNGSGDVIIGDRVRVGIGSVIIGPVTMGHGSGLGQNVFVAGFNHSYTDGTKNSSDQALDIRATTIEDEAHVGSNSVLLAGVTIGKRCQIGAGSVVTKNIPPYSIAVGNPARVIKQYNKQTGKWVSVTGDHTIDSIQVGTTENEKAR